MSDQKHPEERITITNVPPALREDLINIARNLGVSHLSSFLKPKLRDIVNSYPAEMKRKRPDY